MHCTGGCGLTTCWIVLLLLLLLLWSVVVTLGLYGSY